MRAEKLPRGIRNHNPGNIRLTKTKWQGQRAMQFDRDFVEFEAPVMGLRALMKVLLTYYRRYGLDTVQSVINRWAPPHENATDCYAAHVARCLGVRRVTSLDLEKPETLVALAKAIVLHENGHPPKETPHGWYSDAAYQSACHLALTP